MGSLTYEKCLALVDDLGYINYRHNRVMSPNRPYTDWDDIYGEVNVDRYEERFQSENKSR
jgi:hypothetical protein